MKFIQCLYLFLFPCVIMAQDSASDSLQLVFSDAIYFNFGQYELRPEADSTLRNIIEKVDDIHTYIVVITAHTDSIGSIENNKILSEKRANTVKANLSDLGIAETIIQTSIYGETKPVTTNQTDDGRQQNRRATIDVYKVLPKKITVTLEGRVVDEETGEGLVADVIIRTKESKDSLRTNEKGYFKKEMPENTVVGVDVLTKGYFLKSKMFRIEKGKTPPLDIKLPKAEVGKSADIENLYFHGNKAILLPKSEPTLPKVLTFMQVNDDFIIEIAGHINRPNHPPVHESSWDYKLSVRRAKLVYDFLLEHGIEKERVTFKGYGNKYMRYPTARSEQQQSLNRRVEIKILGKVP